MDEGSKARFRCRLSAGNAGSNPADPLSRGVLPRLMCVANVIRKTSASEGLGPRRLLSYDRKCMVYSTKLSVAEHRMAG